MQRIGTILDIMEDTALRLPKKTAVIQEGRRLSYQELMTSARVIGCALCRLKNRGGVR